MVSIRPGIDFQVEMVAKSMAVRGSKGVIGVSNSGGLRLVKRSKVKSVKLSRQACKRSVRQGGV